MDATLNLITALGALLSGIASVLAIWIVKKVHEREKLLTQRQLLLPLWDHLKDLSDIDPAEPVAVDVIKSLNTLELVAVSCEGGMIDPQVIKRVFADVFRKQYMDIEQCGRIEGIGKTGKQLLSENRSTMVFFDSLMTEHKEQGKLSTS